MFERRLTDWVVRGSWFVLVASFGLVLDLLRIDLTLVVADPGFLLDKLVVAHLNDLYPPNDVQNPYDEYIEDDKVNTSFDTVPEVHMLGEGSLPPIILVGLVEITRRYNICPVVEPKEGQEHPTNVC